MLSDDINIVKKYIFFILIFSIDFIAMIAIFTLNETQRKAKKMSFETELKALIKKHLPSQVTICTGKVTYRQTLETPEEYEEIDVDLDADAFMAHYSDIIDDVICMVDDAESCDFVEQMGEDFEDDGGY